MDSLITKHLRKRIKKGNSSEVTISLENGTSFTFKPEQEGNELVGDSTDLLQFENTCDLGTK